MAQTLYVHAMRAASREGLFFAYSKTKAQIRCEVTAQLSGAFFPVFIASIILLLPGSEKLSLNHLIQMFTSACAGSGRET